MKIHRFKKAGRSAKTAFVILWLATAITGGAEPFHDWAATPTMGWNSWDFYGTTLTEEQTRAQADYMAANLLPHEWDLITVDIQWYAPAPAADSASTGGTPPTVDTRTAKGRHAYDNAMLRALRGHGKAMSAPELARQVGGTPLQIRTSLSRLINGGKVTWTGRARGTRYEAA